MVMIRPEKVINITHRANEFITVSYFVSVVFLRSAAFLLSSAISSLVGTSCDLWSQASPNIVSFVITIFLAIFEIVLNCSR